MPGLPLFWRGNEGEALWWDAYKKEKMGII